MGAEREERAPAFCFSISPSEKSVKILSYLQVEEKDGGNRQTELNQIFLTSGLSVFLLLC